MAIPPRAPRVFSHFHEPLEPRRLMAASIAGMLDVRGTDGDDVILLSRNADEATLDVSINGDVQTFNVDDVEEIHIRALGGDDRVTLASSLDDLELEATVSGGAGNDSLIANAGEQLLKGNAGNDTLRGGADGDELDGGKGRDNLTGGADDDVFQITDANSEINDLTEDDGRRLRLGRTPPAVQKTINRIRRRNPLTGLFRESMDGAVVFEAEFLQKRYPRSLKIANDGALIEDEIEIDFADIPRAVRQAVLARYPKAEITEAETAVLEGRLLYEIEVETEDAVREILLTPRGRVLDDEIQ